MPNLVGAETAVKLILENPLNQGKTLTGHRPTSSVLPTRSSAVPTSWSSRSSGRLGCSKATSASTGPRSTAARRGTLPVAKGRGVADSKTGGASPAAYRAVELIAAAKTVDEGRRDSPPRTRLWQTSS